MRVVIIGAGISGLSAAFALATSKSAEEIDLTVIESESRVGGLIQTVRHKDSFIEMGPEGFYEGGEFELLVKKLKLSESRVETHQAARSIYLADRGKFIEFQSNWIKQLPLFLAKILLSGLLSPVGAMRALFECCYQVDREVKSDETIAAFLRRHFGKECYENLLGPIVSSAFLCDLEHLSARFCLAPLLEAESTHGSLLRNAYYKYKETEKTERLEDFDLATGPCGSSVFQLEFSSLRTGLESIIDALVSRLPPAAIRSGTTVETISKNTADLRYEIHCKGGTVYFADAVVLALPAAAATTLMESFNPDGAKILGQIQQQKFGIVNLLFKRKDISYIPAGYGLCHLGAENKNRFIKDVRIPSHMFANRALPNELLLRVRTNEQSLLNLDPVAEIQKELGQMLEIHKAPIFSSCQFHSTIPRFRPGHDLLIQDLKRKVASSPAIFLAGNYLEGYKMDDCIRSGKNAANSILQLLSRETKASEGANLV